MSKRLDVISKADLEEMHTGTLMSRRNALLKCEESFDGFESGLYEVLENRELEEKFQRPIYFYHRSFAEKQCDVFNIWDRADCYSVDIKDLPLRIERWGAYSHIHVEKRLGIYRG